MNIGFLEQPTRNLFFTGKGGVGKTTTATAAAIALSDRGSRVLLVSTDPASNLDEVLGVELSGQVTEIAAVPGLFAINIDPEAAAAAYRERVVGPYREMMPAEAIASIEEQLSGACTVEIAAFNEFTKLLNGNDGKNQADRAGSGDMDTTDFDHIIFDTAPTGHTLRLLELPAAWSDFLEESVGGTSCLGPLSGLDAQKESYENARQSLADSSLTTIIVVSRPDESALAEAARASAELASLKITNQRLVLNGVFLANDENDAVAGALAERCRLALEGIPEALAEMPRTELPLAAASMLGVEQLRAFFNGGADGTGKAGAGVPKVVEATDGSSERPGISLPGLDRLVEDLSQSGQGVIMTLGKGGVGKTTIAADIAAELAGRGYPVHLTTTDPAAHVEAAVGREVDGMTVSRIDPAAETEAYSREVMATADAGLDEQGRALLEEDLRSPCTEEIAVFRAFARTVARGLDGFVVIDTAPTGHTILLLDAAQAYHRQVSQTMADLPEEVRQLLPRLRDPDFTRALVVTLPEATPVHEAAALQEDLRRAGIEPHAWIVNQSLSPLMVSDPVLVGRRAGERRFISEVETLAERVYLVPWLMRVS